MGVTQHATNTENLADTQPLTVVSSPLFGYIDCFQSIKGWRVERYRFSLRPNGVGFDVHEIWRGKPRRVQGDLLPFTREQLISMLPENRSAGVWDDLQLQLLSLFQHRYCVLLEAHGFSVFHMALMSRYTQQNYPYIYWLVLLRDRRWSNENNTDVITRHTLAKALGVSTLSTGQMKALRKLEISGDTSVEHIAGALHFITHQWPECKKFTAHVSSVKLELLQMAGWLLKWQPALIAARWFAVNELQQWLDTRDFNEKQHFWPEVECQVLEALTLNEVEQRTSVLCLLCGIVECMTRKSFQYPEWESTPIALQELLRMPNIVSVKRKAVAILKRRVDTYLDYDNDTAHALGVIVGCGSFAKWRDGVTIQMNPSISSFCEESLVDMTISILDGINDVIYNREIESQYYGDEKIFCKIFPMIGNIHFSCINTAGHLREISGLLRNCAAYRVHLGVEGKAEFWLYRNDKTRESALLQLGIKNPEAQGIKEMRVVEFNGYDNAGVSSAAKQHLADWLNAKTQTCHDLSGVRMCQN
jgi:hypothetical protein